MQWLWQRHCDTEQYSYRIEYCLQWGKEDSSGEQGLIRLVFEGRFIFIHGNSVCAASLISSLVLLCFIWLTQWLFRNFSIFLYLQLNSLLLLKWAFGDNFVCAVLTWKSVNSIYLFIYFLSHLIFLGSACVYGVYSIYN